MNTVPKEDHWKQRFEDEVPTFLCYDKLTGSRWIDRDNLEKFFENEIAKLLKQIEKNLLLKYYSNIDSGGNYEFDPKDNQIIEIQLGELKKIQEEYLLET